MPWRTLIECFIIISKVTLLVDLKLYNVDPSESPTRIMSVYLSIVCAIFFEYAVRQTILNLLFKDLILDIFEITNLF